MGEVGKSCEHSLEKIPYQNWRRYVEPAIARLPRPCTAAQVVFRSSPMTPPIPAPASFGSAAGSSVSWRKRPTSLPECMGTRAPQKFSIKCRWCSSATAAALCPRRLACRSADSAAGSSVSSCSMPSTAKWTSSRLGSLRTAPASSSAPMQARFLRLSERIGQAGLESLGEPHVKHLEGKLWELRLSGRDGIARALYVTAIGRRVVVVRAFVKKTQKTPPAEIELALRRAKEIR
jgi:phage-related protein